MKLFLKFCVAFTLLFLMGMPARGTEYVFDESSDTELYPAEQMDSLYESLPHDVKSELDGYFSANDDDSRTDKLKEKLDFGYVMDFMWSTVTSVIPSWLGTLGTLLAVIVIASIVKNTLTNSMSEDVSANITSMICAVAAGGVALKSAETARVFISSLCGVMNAMIPVMSAVMLTGGGITQASVNSGALMLYITTVQNITDKLLVPVAGSMFALSTFSGVFKGVNISSFISGVQKLLMTLFGFSLMVFSFVLGIQTSLASSADSLGMKTVRFAVGSYVPFVGGAVSEALSTVTAGLSHIRHMAGAVGVVIILLTVLPTLISLLLSRITLVICKSVADTLECHEAASPIDDAQKVISLFLAFSAMTGVFFIFATVLFMNSGLY
ncbi:MAG: hypothetical protein IKM46_01935 [Clostridia bacterium]|nr:hypothetical protein [Clostridia bacterium]